MPMNSIDRAAPRAVPGPAASPAPLAEPAADVVTALMSYSVESGKDYATVLKEVYAILRGKFVANAADPTSIEFYAPDGTTVRVTHTLTDTTRTPS
jgi:hypothetical protein